MIDSGTEIAPKQREAWLAERRKGIGASECAAALGLSPFPDQTPLNLWARKLGLEPEAAENEAMAWGTRLEPLIAEEYERRTGRRIEERQVFAWAGDSPPPLCATLDAINDDGRPVEFKCLSAFKAGTLGEEGTDELPDHWLLQAQMQMFVHERLWVDFAVLVGGTRFRLFAVPRDQKLIEAVLPRLAEFWRHVETQTAPPATGKDVGLLERLHPNAAGEVELDFYSCNDADDWEQFGEDIRRAQKSRDRAKASLLEALGDHAVGILPDGRRIKRTVVEHEASTRQVKAYKEVRLSIFKPKENY